MTLAFWMVLVAAILPYAAVFYAKYDPKFDNHAPRKFLEKQKGAKQRAYWAHQNSFEIFPLFAAAVIIAFVKGADPVKIDILAFGFVCSRIAYIFAYISDHPSLRSVIWSAGLGCIIGMFVLALL